MMRASRTRFGAREWRRRADSMARPRFVFNLLSSAASIPTLRKTGPALSLSEVVGTRHFFLTRSFMATAKVGMLSPRPVIPEMHSWLTCRIPAYGMAFGTGGGLCMGGVAASVSLLPKRTPMWGQKNLVSRADRNRSRRACTSIKPWRVMDGVVRVGPRFMSSARRFLLLDVIVPGLEANRLRPASLRIGFFEAKVGQSMVPSSFVDLGPRTVYCRGLLSIGATENS